MLKGRGRLRSFGVVFCTALGWSLGVLGGGFFCCILGVDQYIHRFDMVFSQMQLACVDSIKK